MNDTMQTLLREATRLTQSGRLSEATEAIQRALSGSDPSSPAAPPCPSGTGASQVFDGEIMARSVQAADVSEPIKPDPVASRDRTLADAFIQGSHSHAGLTRRYKLYVPADHAGQALPLVMMLHGCTQNPDDFAAGTRMNDLAREQRFFVLYPEQAQDSNPQRCWNWFNRSHQQRGSGEPALLASMTRTVMAEYAIDARRVYVAGLSAGGAMAAVMGSAYPELFAAVGVHSGLPTGAATNVAEALAVMKRGTPRVASSARAPLATSTLPTIVFHGSKDQVVHPKNGEHIINGLLAENARGGTLEQGISASGTRYKRAVHRDASGEVIAEHWLLQEAGHAWSGGSPAGSYTDPKGPDASAEMLRFFLQHRRVD